MTSTPPVVVRNPNSGDGKRSRRAREIALDRGYEVLDSEGGEHKIELTADSRPRAMRFFVGLTYDPSPEEWGGTTPK